ncbi:Tetracenomycin polyketide synthesis hydroxylase TcmG [Cyphellophora attinorum]|uniref:Tetracenomycin polyketide synthesis hydroxylase TcmG n=1 Tax=Cyphellophora attinorum TaxID=1664694 RepID=A0A0N1NWM4_9EURO|nr:Tetracenomycin polyketide synthesis hydroxylase TcmG [Phialophora attinorum]KPI37044.1 Tetracenomycin polyketide synthesis hydroxylase TcmG [Phialophora attinorum]
MGVQQNGADQRQPPDETPVLIVGAGPAGLIAALQLSKNGQRCVLIERNLDTTKWPKMDITNCRSMELLKRLDVDRGLREVGVSQEYSFDVNISTGLSEGGQLIAKWPSQGLPSPDAWRKRIRTNNDGSNPREPYQRCSQAIFEAWLKPQLQSNPLVDAYFGWKLESLTEESSHVDSTLVDTAGNRHSIRSRYVIGCDGAGSKVRSAVGIALKGGPVPGAMHLIHFKSRDLSRLHKQGQFWHIFFTSGSVIISQDEIDTWTVHTPIPVGADVSDVDPKQAIYRALGGDCAPYEIEIDEVLVTSTWRPNIYLADKYMSQGKRIFLSGDAAHQNIPTGGYGMNTAVGDSFDIGWKIAAVLAGHGGPHLLDSYEAERRPVAARNLERSGVHHTVHATYQQWCLRAPSASTSQNEEGRSLRDRIAAHVAQNDGENTDHGIELGYRYNGSGVIVTDDASQEPAWTPKEYVPSTWPGARAPHVYLSDGKTSIFDKFGTGPAFTLVDFSADGKYAQSFERAARSARVPLEVVRLLMRRMRGRYGNAMPCSYDRMITWPGAHPQMVRPGPLSMC